MDDMKRTSEYRRMLPFIAKASNDVGEDTQGENVQALILALDTHKNSADHDGRYSLLDHLHDDRYSLLEHLHDDRYYTESEINSLLNAKAEKTLTLTAGNGLTVGGTLAADRTFNVGQGFGLTVSENAVAVDLTANFTWTGSHTFSGSLTTGSIMPALADVYDLGDYTKPWRKIWGSELSAVVFSQYEQVLLGGWLTISKGEGKLADAVASTDTEIDLGAGTFAENDILVFRSTSSNGTPQVEYMKVGTLVSATTYNVTRNLDGTGANDWPVGTVYGNWGQAGNGRVELNAYDTPRMSVFSHGIAIANFREQIRIGDLSGGWGYGTPLPAVYGVSQYGANRYGRENYGAAFGAYEVGQANITIDPANGVRIRNYDQDVIKLNGLTASFENFITLGLNGGLRQGTGTWGVDFTGSAIWAESSVMNIGGWNAGIKQWWGGSDGKLYAGEGSVRLDKGGVNIVLSQDENVGYLRFQSTDLMYDKIFMRSNPWDALTIANLVPGGEINQFIRGIDGINRLARFWFPDTNIAQFSVDGELFVRLKGVDGINRAITFWYPGTNISQFSVDGQLYVKPGWTAAIGTSVNPVYGLIVRSTGNTAATAALLLENNDGTDLFSVSSVGNASLVGVMAIGRTFNTDYGLIVKSPGITDTTHALLLQNSAFATLLYVNSVGNSWLAGNCSALSFTDRTPYYEGDALAEINKIKGKTNPKYKGTKEIDHSTLPSFVRKQHVNADKSFTEERDLGAMVSMLTVAVQQLSQNINEVRNAVSNQ